MSDPVDATASTTALPTGTVTFVMTDIEGSTRLVQALGDRYPQLLAEHYGLLREAFGSAGVEAGSEGDALFYAFTDAPSAVRAALDAQRRLFEHRDSPASERRFLPRNWWSKRWHSGMPGSSADEVRPYHVCRRIHRPCRRR